MPLSRSSKVDSLYTVAQLLSHLQLNGHLDNIAVPDWAEGGTSVEELMEALRVLGNGRWLVDADDGRGAEEAADQWLLEFFQGSAVPSREDLKPKSHSRDHYSGAEIDEPAGDFTGMLEAYFEMLPENHQQRARARLLNEKDFLKIATKHIHGISDSLAVCALAPDDDFQAHSHECLEPEAMSDQDLRAMAIFFLQHEETLQASAEFGPDAVTNARRRSLAIVKALLRGDQTR